MALARLKGKIPKEIPFELKRCESCRRAKQGAIVCRVVRGWKRMGAQAQSATRGLCGGVRERPVAARARWFAVCGPKTH